VSLGASLLASLVLRFGVSLGLETEIDIGELASLSPVFVSEADSGTVRTLNRDLELGGAGGAVLFG